jgi:von Willebrand factor type A domain
MTARQWFLLGALTVALGACGSVTGGDGNSPAAPCEGPGCGKPCSSDSSCSIGYHCGSAEECTAECTQGGSECGSDRHCDTRGYCRDGEGEPTNDAGVCPSIRVNVEPVIPTVQLLIDHSGSMNVDFGGDIRVDAVREALLDPNDGIVVTLQSQVRFGASLYTSDDGNQNPPCPTLSGVGPALDNFEDIEQAIADDLQVDRLGEDTPTGESLEAIAESFPPAQGNDRRIIVLATDGLPDTCTLPDPDNETEQAQANRRSEDAAKRVFDDFGIEIYVLSVGEDATLSHLQRVANAGVGKDFDDPDEAPVYVANDKGELIAAFNSIIGGARECSFSLNGTVTDPAGGTVTLNGEKLEYGTDWDLVGSSTLRLLGESCDTYLNSTAAELEAEFECDSIVDVPIE